MKKTLLESYDGWNGYFTWAAHIFLTDSEGSQQHCQYLAREALETDDPEETLADNLRDIVKDNAPRPEPSFYTDILDAAVDLIDFNEIARVMLEEADDD